MTIARHVSLLVFTITLMQASVVRAQVGVTSDAKGVRDPPEIPRISGSLLVDGKHDNYDESQIPLAQVAQGGVGFDESVKFEGERTRVLYVLPDQYGPLEVERNYQSVLAKRGYRLVFSCQFKDCDHSGPAYYYFSDAFYQESSRKLKGRFGDNLWNQRGSLDRFAVFRRDAPNGGYAMLAVGNNHSNDWENRKVKGRNAAYFEIVEAKAMTDSMVTVTAADMSRDLRASGKTILYAILFDFDKTVVKPGSRPQLEEMAKLLKKDPRLGVFIVGHTDDRGTVAYNLDLSQRRAEAVTRALATEHKVDTRQILPKGLANFAPVASNEDESGRAKNRRVELVKQ